MQWRKLPSKQRWRCRLLQTARAIALAHEELARHSGAAAVLSVVMTAGGNCSGVILLERDRGDAFDDQTIELLEAVAALVGPALLTKSETDKLITGRAVRSAGSGLRALFGPRRPAVKIAAVAICATAAYLALAEGDFPDFRQGRGGGRRATRGRCAV